jgi:tetratricopeptide (TPR) repeat protein
LAEAINETRRSRVRFGLLADARAETVSPAGEPSAARAARLLGDSFLPGPVFTEMAKLLAAAQRDHQPVRLGLEVPPELARLPWEALPSPDGHGPLVLHPLVRMYRKADAAAARRLPAPLRIVVAIAAPDAGGGPLLDYERELHNVLAEVRSARRDAAEVRVVPFATPRAIREELDRGPTHILHISGHGSPGTVALEDEDGAAWRVTADEFLDQAIPPGQVPPVVTLSACFTDTAASSSGVSFAARLCQRGAAAVIATEASITDTYATKLLARVYGALAQASDPDVVAAFSTARRETQSELETSPDRRYQELAGLGEWAAVTVLAATGSVPVLDSEPSTQAARGASGPRSVGLAGREDWYFVGRRPEQRKWPADLTSSSLAGIVLHGIGGVGKTTLAAEIITRLRSREPSRVVVSLTGPVTLEGLIGTVVTAIRGDQLMNGHDATAAIEALDIAGRTDAPWRERLAMLRGQVLDEIPVLLLLDNFEDNLRPDGAAGYLVGDEALAGLLAAWAADPGRSRLLVTCRYRFTLPGGAEQALSFRQLGALSRAETMKFAWSLPALDRLDESQLVQVWRLVGGHPRSLEYLDALLSGDQARYDDVTGRLSAAVGRRMSGADRGTWLAAGPGLDAALAETVALAADDVLLDDLLARLAQVPGAADMLLGISLYRQVVDRNALLFQIGQPDPDAEHIPDRESAFKQIRAILAAAGITVDESLDLASIPGHVQARLAPHAAELNRLPAPPFRTPAGLDKQIAACQAASLLTVSGDAGAPRFFVHRWTATELAARAGRDPRQPLAEAHRRTAAYWQWHARVWPEDLAAGVHDLLEARHHLLQAGDSEVAGEVTERAASQLHTWGAWDQEASLIHDTLARLPSDSPRRGALIGRLGEVAQARGEYDEAARLFQRSLDIREQRGDQVGTAAAHSSLGVLAQSRGDYDEAARQEQFALGIFTQLGNQAGMATSYHNLGILAQYRGDYDEAARLYQDSLDIEERLGNAAGMAGSYHQLGMLDYLRGNPEEAARRYQRALDIRTRLGDQDGMAASHAELGMAADNRGDQDGAARHYKHALDIFARIGNQAGMAHSYRQLGGLAQDRGDYDEAARQYQRAMDIFARIGDKLKVASSHHALGILAQDREDYDEAERHYRHALDIRKRLGLQGDLADSYHQLGNVAFLRGDEEEAARQYQHALDIRQQLGDLSGLADSYHQLGVLAQAREAYDEAARQYQQSMDIMRRIGDKPKMAWAYHNLGILEKKRGGSVAAIMRWHVEALMIWVGLVRPEAIVELRELSAYRRALGAEAFTIQLTKVVTDPHLAETIRAALDQVDETEDRIA